MKKQISTGFMLALFALVNSPVFSQLPFIQYSTPPGVTVSNARMNDLEMDASNNKWIAFANYGLGMFDNSTWTMFNTTNSTIVSDSITCIDFDGSGNIWLGSKLGAMLKSGSTFTVFNTTNSGISADIITEVFVDGNNVWFGTYQGLSFYNGTNWTIYNTSNSGLENDSITKIAMDNTGLLWIGTRNGLVSYDGTTWTPYNTTNSILKRYILDIEPDANNRIWISSGTYSPSFKNVLNPEVVFISNSQFFSFNGDMFDFDDFVAIYPTNSNLTSDASGNIYFYVNVNGQEGVFRVNGSTYDFFEITGINGGSTQFGRIIEIDNTGNLLSLPRFRFYFYILDFAGYDSTSLYGGPIWHRHRTIDINEVKAGINIEGDMHWDFSTAQYEVPKGSGKNSVFASALWIGGLDQSSQLHLAAQTYRQTGMDFWPGPIDGISAPFDSATCREFNRIWKLDKWKVEAFKFAFLSGSVSNGTYPIPEEISSWPAKGNGMVVNNLAPFIDADLDGIYNPMNGDYPDMKGDQMLFFIFNDSLAPHTETAGLKMGVEVQATVYAFNCTGIADSNKVLNRTTLYNYKIINRSAHNYSDVYLGNWSDMDLGNAVDDYVGCDTLRAAGFAYNGDNDDETLSGYGINPPMQNIKILRGTLADPGDGIDNDLDGITDEAGERTAMNHFQYYNNINNSPIGNPNGAADFYKYLRSFWLDGIHVTYGGSGYNSSPTSTNFMFPSAPFSGSGWSELTAGNWPEDRRFVMSSGPFTLASGDTATLDFAYVFTWHQSAANGLNTSIARNRADLDRIQYWFNTNSFPSCQVYNTGLDNTTEVSLQLVPNPTHDYFEIKHNSGMEIRSLTVCDIMGRKVFYEEVVPNHESVMINCSNWSPGIYHVSMITGNKTISTKLVKY